MRLYVLRHGDAVESPYYHDSQRPLSDLGQRQIQSVARFLSVSRNKIDLILTSPLVRARETAQIIQKALDIPQVISTESLAGGNLRDVVADINSHDVSSLLLVGHEPQLSSLISHLTASDEQFRLELRKASLACVESQTPVKRGHAVLAWLVTAPQMELVR